MRYYIIAGEASGDMHASNLMREIKKLDTEAVFRCWGGDLMQAAGGELVKHYRDLAFMGFLEVALNISTILKNINYCKEDITRFRPDTVILVDYPGFNLRIAEFAHDKGFRVIYYISPQVWAWKRSRVYGIRKNVGKMLVILPFEEEFYRKYDYKVEFTGHPLLDVTDQPSSFDSGQAFRSANGLTDKPVIAVLPGSRKQEIKRILPLMVSIANDYKDYEFVIAGAPSIEKGYYSGVAGQLKLKILSGNTHELLRYSHAALVASGTATLETALFNVPQVVCYRGSAVSYAIARRIVNIKYISLVNLIMDKKIVTELIQGDYNRNNLRKELDAILDEANRTRMTGEYKILRERLGGKGASGRAAESIVKWLMNINA